MKNTDIISPIRLAVMEALCEPLGLGAGDIQLYVNGSGMRLALKGMCAEPHCEAAQKLGRVDEPNLIRGMKYRNRNIYIELSERVYLILLEDMLALETEYAPLNIHWTRSEEKLYNACSLPCVHALIDEESLLTRISYTQRRMWMLARKASGEPRLTSEPDIMKAILTTALMLSFGGKGRILGACDALLAMTRTKRLTERNRRAKEAAHTGMAAVKALSLVYNNEVRGV